MAWWCDQWLEIPSAGSHGSIVRRKDWPCPCTYRSRVDVRTRVLMYFSASVGEIRRGISLAGGMPVLRIRGLNYPFRLADTGCQALCGLRENQAVVRGGGASGPHPVMPDGRSGVAKIASGKSVEKGDFRSSRGVEAMSSLRCFVSAGGALAGSFFVFSAARILDTLQQSSQGFSPLKVSTVPWTIPDSDEYKASMLAHA